MSDNRFTVLSIEDNKPDFDLLKKVLNQIPDLSLDIINIDNGKDALDFVFKINGYEEATTPDIIILDINLPSISGKEILKTIKQDNTYKIIPIIIYSTSSSDSDIKDSYDLYANSYITKTFNTDELFRKIANIGTYWLKTNEVIKKDNCYFYIKEKKNEDTRNRR